MSASLALSNLRAVAILIVLAFHSVLAYLASLPESPYRLDDPSYRWQAFPIVDSQRWIGFDLFCAWQYLSLMALMFFLSGLFVAPSLARKGSWGFLSSRLLRIGVPLVVAIAVLTPLAYYPAYRVTAPDPSFSAFWNDWLALPFWPLGSQWFLLLLLAMNVFAALLHRFAPGLRDRLIGTVALLADSPIRLFAGLMAVTALAYVPLALIFSPWAWTNVGPVAFQTARPLFYLAYFFAGYAIGAHGLGWGPLACDGALARNWAVWFVVAIVGFGLWAGASSMTLGNWSEVQQITRLVAGLAVVVGCAAGCFFPLALCLRFGRKRRRALDSLSANAYGIYLLHYVVVVWLQYALLEAELPAIGKAALVFGGALLVAWPLAAAFGSMPLGARPIGVKQKIRNA